MRFIVGSMMVIFFVAGVALVWGGIRSALLVARRRGQLRRAEGVIVDIERKYMRSAGSNGRGSMANYPVIRFQTDGGESVTFRSEVGDMGDRSRYAPDQPIAVLYDPGGVLRPTLDTWFGLWGSSLMIAVGGLAFIGGAGLIWFAFGDRIIGV